MQEASICARISEKCSAGSTTAQAPAHQSARPGGPLTALLLTHADVIAPPALFAARCAHASAGRAVSTSRICDGGIFVRDNVIEQVEASEWGLRHGR